VTLSAAVAVVQAMYSRQLHIIEPNGSQNRGRWELRGLYGVAAGAASIFVASVAIPGAAQSSAASMVLALSGVEIFFSLLTLAAAYGLWQLDEWGWILAMVVNFALILSSAAQLILEKIISGNVRPVYGLISLSTFLLAIIFLFYLFRNDVMLAYEAKKKFRQRTGRR
jgi:hypothetical protein